MDFTLVNVRISGILKICDQFALATVGRFIAIRSITLLKNTNFVGIFQFLGFLKNERFARK